MAESGHNERAQTAQSVIVASRNPVKIGAAKEGFTQMFPSAECTFKGISVPSGVADQPMTDAETLQGAINRARRLQELEPQADYWVGIEGGVDDSGDAMESFAWVVVLGRRHGGRDGDADSGVHTAKARTAAFYQPEEVAKLVRAGVELGPANDRFFGTENSKHHSGSVGLLTGGLIDRSSYYVPAVILALIPFRNTNLTFV